MKYSKPLAIGIVGLLLLCFFAFADEKVLYEKKSKYNHIFVTEDGRGYRSLLFEDDGDLQSVVKLGDPDHLELVYARVMTVGLAFVPKPKRVLIVGLGGGSIPSFLRKHYPKMEIDVVDIDPDVVRVAKKFFGFREDRLLKAHVADGRKFIEKCKKPYDIVFLDAYGKDNIPRSLATREFFQAVRKALSPKGIVVGNIFSRYSNPLYDSMIRTYQVVFEELYIFGVRDRGNKIFVTLPFKYQIPRERLARTARSISKKNRFRFDLGEIVNYGYGYATEQRVTDPILTDHKRGPKKVSPPRA